MGDRHQELAGQAPAGAASARGPRGAGVRRLPVEDLHLAALAELPSIHRDPFDRMLIAQARVEGLTVITSDAVFARYDVPVLDARS
ncbi:type II toxin-antitoxin system VapC family toxin [Klenkia sp. PcliD-1-E]|uniref:type II toxin-antitoxin system VapC family toxin n=1 Tax=Klenkia sp. PcliD-1-E TaxID=2954492 RepID=UPI002097EABE|nr:type II toxin-antitoxin system VapC family toxin [Klenkia sp. PcliD-1-E]MCO7220674.1 type II toxin-antitoxin system VapC family toxin [Klenkia sp. PcliD-1-E]